MSCDAELQELMIQVDRMVEEKRMEWQEKIKNTENKLNSTLQDNYNLKTIIEEKNNEIANIKNRIKYTDNISNIFDYDQQVLELRLELSQIKKSYEKYYHKYTKKTKEIEKEKEELCKEKIILLKEINEHRSSQKKYQDEISAYQEHIKEFELKRNTFLVEREALNEQIKLMKTEFNDQLNNYADAERKYLQNLKDLENKLCESKITLQNEIDGSKTKLCEALQQTKKSMDEKQQLIIDNDSAKRMIMRLENELSRVSTENKIKEKTICKMQQVINVSEKTINEKNEVLRALQSNSTSKDYVGTVSKLESDLFDAKSSVKSCKKNEKSLQIEIQILQKKLKDAQEMIENEKIQRGDFEATLKRLSIAENEKSNLFDQMKNKELIIENKKTEITNLKSKLERLEIANEELISDQLRKESEKQVNNNDNMTNRPNYRRKSEEECFMQSAESLLKERNYLLKFCEDKDLIIHRLQLENRILQDFISKLNSGLSNEVQYINHDLNEDNGLSVLDNYQALKETFTDYDVSAMNNVDKQTENHNQNNPISSKSSSSKHAAEYLTNSTDSFSNLNFYHSHESFSETINKSSEEFLARLMQSNPADHVRTDEQESYLKVYPTLAAAKYFTDEREKTRQIEKQIDFHMNQLKKKTETKRSISNQ